MNKKRIDYIDFIKVIGLSCIIIAHVGLKGWVIAIRQFDVILMVIVSAILARLSYDKHVKNHIAPYRYCFQRFKRLVIPTWLFLIIYFAKCIILSRSFQDISVYINSFLLTRYGIGYVWIILIYLYSALSIPIIYKFKKTKYEFIYVFIVYIVYELLYYYKLGINNPYIESTVYYIIPYVFVTYIGYSYYSLIKKQRYSIMIISLCCVLALGFYYFNRLGKVQDFGIAKYPPRIYYISYGVLISYLLLELFRNYSFKIYNCKLVKYISSHSLWIYLWHILALDIYAKFNLPEVWYLKFIGVFSISIIIVLCVNVFLDKTELDNKFKIFKYFRG